MNIGIVPILDPGSGGIYQYSQTMLDVLKSPAIQERGDSFILLVRETGSQQAAALRSSGWEVQALFPPSGRYWIQDKIKQFIGFDVFNKAWRLSQQVSHGAGIDRVRRQPGLTRWLKSHQVDLMIYPAPEALAFEVDVPYVMAVHDLQHRLQPQFPEMSASGNLYWREYLFRNAAHYATLLISESEVGKQDILEFYSAYGTTDQRIKVLPFLPAVSAADRVSEDEIRRVRAEYRLAERYLFYPAQFWPHKNHARIVEALHRIDQEYHLKIQVVFSGCHTGRQRSRNFGQLSALVRELGMTGQILFPGYVPDRDMPGLYAGAAALIMPTFFGPSNIPVLEAWAYGCPVITSDIHGIREQCGDAALLVDPISVQAIANGVYRLWSDQALCEMLVAKGRERLSRYTREDYTARLCDILDEAKRLVTNYRGKRPELGL